MSLFGGDGIALRSPTLSHTADSPSELSPSPQSAQAPPASSFALELGSDNLLDEFDEDEFQPTSESDAEPTDSTHLVLKPPTWRRYTAADREIGDSLENIESADLAAHLYNTHNLKQRARRPPEALAEIKGWHNKESWLGKGKELQFEDPLGEIQSELVPSKLWTAWPRAPHQLPAKGSTIGTTEDGEHGWYVGSSTSCNTGEVMREEVLALLLRSAKEQWLARQRDYEDMATSGAERERSSSTAVSSRDSDIDMIDEHSVRISDVSESETEGEQTVRDVNDPTVESESGEPLYKTNPRSLSGSPLPPLDSAFLADDNEARRILEPLVNSLLSSIDCLALAIRRSRLNHFGSHAFSPGSGSDYLTDAETPAPRSRASSRPQSSGRSRKKSTQPSLPKKSYDKTSKQDRKKMSSHDSDSASDYGADHDSESDGDSNSSGASRRRRVRSISRNSSPGSDASNNLEIKRYVGLMDWSEVLGIATIAGWNKRAITRTTQRCASLFGEGMSFRAFDEGLATQHLAEPVQYNPSTVPTLGDLGSHEPGFLTSTKSSKRPYFKPGTLRCPHRGCTTQWKYPSDTIKHVKRVHSYDPRTNNTDNAFMESTPEDMRDLNEPPNSIPSKKRPYFEPHALRCPHLDCPHSMKEFDGSNRLIQHLKRAHGYDPRTNESDNEERTVGGVHIDGFLQPIWAKPGWFGEGRAKSEDVTAVINRFSEKPRQKKQRPASKPTTTAASENDMQDEHAEDETDEDKVEAATQQANMEDQIDEDKTSKKVDTNQSLHKLFPEEEDVRWRTPVREV
ncbi:N-terminal acetyltransferase [Kalmusia sp. IMI 367209]|nr:N-terminal acetyltransferase [Kalmusia sp. IMI 367209]